MGQSICIGIGGGLSPVSPICYDTGLMGARVRERLYPFKTQFLEGGTIGIDIG